jgi:hypothetical protein
LSPCSPCRGLYSEESSPIILSKSSLVDKRFPTSSSTSSLTCASVRRCAGSMTLILKAASAPRRNRPPQDSHDGRPDVSRVGGAVHLPAGGAEIDARPRFLGAVGDITPTRREQSIVRPREAVEASASPAGFVFRPPAVLPGGVAQAFSAARWVV